MPSGIDPIHRHMLSALGKHSDPLVASDLCSMCGFRADYAEAATRRMATLVRRGLAIRADFDRRPAWRPTPDGLALTAHEENKS